MRGSYRSLIGAVALVLVVAPLGAQGWGGRGPRDGAAVDRPWNPIEALIERREALELTDEQVGRLEAIRARVERENAGRVEQLRQARGDTPWSELSEAERAQLRERLQALESVRTELRASHRQALDEAREVLTAEQRAELGDVMRRGRALRGEGRAGRPARGTRGPGQSGMAGGAMARNPVSVLLERREDLELTAEQVDRLEALQARVERENAPRIEQLRAAFAERPVGPLTEEQRAELRERMESLQPVRQALRETNRQAMEEARAVLSTEQATRLRDVMRRGGDRPGRSPGPDARPGRPRGGLRGA